MTQPTVTPGGGRDADAGRGISTYRSYNQQIITEAARRLELAQQELARARAAMARHEQVKAQLAANGVAPQTSAGMDQLIEAEQAAIAAARDKVAAAERERAAAQTNLAKLDSMGHTSAEQAIKGMGDQPAANISWYRPPR